MSNLNNSTTAKSNPLVLPFGIPESQHFQILSTKMFNSEVAEETDIREQLGDMKAFHQRGSNPDYVPNLGIFPHDISSVPVVFNGLYGMNSI